MNHKPSNISKDSLPTSNQYNVSTFFNREKYFYFFQPIYLFLMHQKEILIQYFYIINSFSF